MSYRLRRRGFEICATWTGFDGKASQPTAQSPLQWPTNRSAFSKKEKLGRKSRGSQGAGHGLKRFAFCGGGVGIEAHGECFDQGRPVRPLERVQPGVTLGDLSAGQPNPNRAVQPAGPFGQGGQERLTQKETLPGRGDRPEPQFASLVPPVQYHSPAERRSFLPIPFEHSDELLA